MSSDVPVRLRPEVQKAPKKEPFLFLQIMIRRANFSKCRKYRYLLEREWDASKPSVLFVMLNPSKADHKQDDPTIRRCIEFAKDLGFGSLCIANLFAYKATLPSDLAKAEEPNGKRNLEFLRKAKRKSDAVITAWGVSSVVKKLQPTIALKLISSWDTYSLGYCKDGTPRHPLYLRKESKLIKNERRFSL